MSIRALAVVGKAVVLSMAVLAVAAANSRNAQAVPIFVPNGSFETPVLNDGASNNAPSGWVIVAGSLNQHGAFNPVNAQFSGTTGGPAPSPAQGNNIGLINLTRSAVAGSDFSSFTSSASLTTLEAGGTYLATVAFGRRATTYIPDLYQIDLLVNDVVYAPATVTLNGGTIAADSFVDLSTSFIAMPAQAGATLKIRITQSTFAGSGVFAGHFDNVRLDFTPAPVPEPSSLVLLGLGVLGFVRQGRRRNRKG